MFAKTGYFAFFCNTTKSKSKMKKFIILTITACFFALSGASAANTDNQQKGKALSKAELLNDYDYFFGKFEEIHPNPYDAFGGKTA